jgi:hypothetical protein
LGTLFALWDQVFGVRLNQGDMPRWRDRARHARRERRLTILGSVLVLASIPVEVAGW